LLEFRLLADFAEEIVVLLMDNCSAHVIDDVIHLLIEARVRVIAFAPHTARDMNWVSDDNVTVSSE
jgi:hypothetical protein